MNSTRYDSSFRAVRPQRLRPDQGGAFAKATEAPPPGVDMRTEGDKRREAGLPPLPKSTISDADIGALAEQKARLATAPDKTARRASKPVSFGATDERFAAPFAALFPDEKIFKHEDVARTP